MENIYCDGFSVLGVCFFSLSFYHLTSVKKDVFPQKKAPHQH